MTDVRHSSEADNKSHGKEPQCNHLTDTKEGNRQNVLEWSCDVRRPVMSHFKKNTLTYVSVTLIVVRPPS